jgi:hypothetical protein
MIKVENLEQHFADFKISNRARKIVQKNYGSLSEVASHVRKRETKERDLEIGGFYTIGGVFCAVELGWFLPKDFDSRGCGQKTALEIAKALIILGAATLDECFPKGREYPLRVRLRFNQDLLDMGWTGPFLPGKKHN